jgi:release factor glutamine methyltransferase
MTAKEIFDSTIKEIEPLYGNDEARSIAFSLLEHIGIMKTAVLAHQPMETDTSILQKWIERLKKYEPLQYILGETTFYKRIFRVNSSVLIPRPETEELMEWIIRDFGSVEEDFSEKPAVTIMDIGTGSACIAVTLAKEIAESAVFAMDISEEALKVAKENALLNHADVHFLKQDILHDFDFQTPLDIVVSNPPYVTENEKSAMQANVLNYEPHLALFVPNEKPQLFYQRIATFAKKYLKPTGVCYLELNANLAHQTAELFDKEGFTEIIIKKDLSGNNRMLRAAL